MREDILKNYDRFQIILNKLGKTHTLKTLSPDVYVLLPQGLDFQDEDKIPFSIGAIIHGNESCGLASLSEFLELFVLGVLRLDYPLGFFLGNIKAALSEKRFLEKDLNRSFLSGGLSLEEKRATEILPLLKRSTYFLDLHQTNLASAHPFFIFPYTPKALAFAKALSPEIPIVTHWGGGFSKDGMCSDEAVNHFGGCGITLETGQCGIRYEQQILSVYLLTKAHSWVHSRGINSMGLPNNTGKIYTWAHIVPYPENAKQITLEPGWYNFKPVAKNQRIGMIDEYPLLAQSGGYMLFPKYMTAAPQGGGTTKELCRIVREIELSELPASGRGDH